jgi:two-component system, OmpR family, phosphate regulon response regulator PhoB
MTNTMPSLSTKTERNMTNSNSFSPLVTVVEDEETLGILLRYNLEAEGYRVDLVTRGDEAETRLAENHPDLVILDWMLPGVSGIELCRRFRTKSEFQRVPIIMLTARGEESERVRGLATGADDYVVKPFSTPELMARVKALLRRTNPSAIAFLLKVGDIQLDRESHRVHRLLREVKLGPTEFRLLEFLLRAPGRVFSRSQLLDGVWGGDVYVDDRTVDVHIGRLRKALNRGRDKDPIRTVRGSGYALEAV